MKTCQRGHPYDPGQKAMACPFCTGIWRSQIVKSLLFAASGMAVVATAAMRWDGVTLLGGIVSVLLWVPAWLGVAMASLGNRHLVLWAGLTYAIGGFFLRTPGGMPAWHPVLDALRWLTLPDDVGTWKGWILVGWLQGFLLGLIGCSVDVLLRRLTNEPDPPDVPVRTRARSR